MPAAKRAGNAAKVVPLTQKSPMDRLKELEAERQALVGEQKEVLLAQVNEALADLKAMGLDYRLTEGAEWLRRNTGTDRRGTRTVNAARPCPVCGFRTDPPHDARRHRGQDVKRPFTDAELTTAGMRRIPTTEGEGVQGE
jgi:hypothetical protein